MIVHQASNPALKLPSPCPPIFLIGLSGSGKSTVGRLLADRFQLTFVDTDREIERRTGSSVARLFAESGELAFRAIERELVLEVCKRENVVVATGGGAPLDAQSRSAMRRRGVALWLDAPDPVLVDRLCLGTEPRPLLANDPVASLERLRRDRSPTYASLGSLISADGALSDVVTRSAERICQLAGHHTVLVKAPSQTYNIHVDVGVLNRVVELLDADRLRGHLRVIADERVDVLHGDQLRHALKDRAATWYRMPAGEEHKTLDQAGRVFDQLLADKPERSDIIVAFGGGVVGDLVGFVAATLLRGVRFVQIPTTVLSQVDSSVGGKVAVDHPRGKNLIGAFHQPSMVIADVDLLRSLPPREIAAGWAEVVKIAMIQDAAFFEELESLADDLRALEGTATTAAIRRAIELKARLVEVDERDLTGARAVLNYGHTLGHALEAATSYGSLLHGEAVAIGMRGAAHIAQALGRISPDLASRQGTLLTRLGLPQAHPGPRSLDIYTAMGLDKKRSEGRTQWVLPLGLGNVGMSADVPPHLVEEAINLITRAS